MTHNARGLFFFLISFSTLSIAGDSEPSELPEIATTLPAARPISPTGVSVSTTEAASETDYIEKFKQLSARYRQERS